MGGNVIDVRAKGYIGQAYQEEDYVKARFYETLDPPDLNWPIYAPTFIWIKAYGEHAERILTLGKDEEVELVGELKCRDRVTYGEYGETGRKTTLWIELR